MPAKKCSKCGRFASKDRFSRTNPAVCKKCYNAWMVEYKKSYYRDIESFESKTKRAINQRERTLRRQYGITLDEYNDLLDAQGGRCAVCRKVETALFRDGQVRNLAVDHCHETNTVRGLLCGRCNVGIGLLEDDPDLVRRAAAYLDSFSCVLGEW